MESQADNKNQHKNDNAPPLPDATSETLVLTRPTDEEKRRTWTLNYREWGGALSLDQYLQREPYVTTIPLSRDGGMAHWILTTQDQETSTKASPPSPQRPVLASCESIRKRVLVARPPPLPRGSGEGAADDDGQVTEAIGYGIGSVYTYPEYRGRSYAKRMLKELGVVLRETQPGKKHGGGEGEGEGEGQKTQEKGGPEPASEPQQRVVCSALWSDIGKLFYASKGWHPFPSVHVSFPARSSSSKTNSNNSTNPRLPLVPITYANLASFAALDEAQLRRRLARTAARTGRTAFAFAPDHDALRWHLYRDGFVASFLHGGAVPPTDRRRAADGGGAEGGGSFIPGSGPGEMETKGAVATTVAASGVQRRVWAVWARNYQAPPSERPEDRARNTLYVLRLVVEGGDEDGERDEEGEEGGGEKKALREALAAVLGAARDEAARWGCGKVDLWNPTPLVRRLLEGIDGSVDGDGHGALPREWVDRDTDSIPSLMWYGLAGGDGKKEDGEGEGEVEWVANEKYCWC